MERKSDDLERVIPIAAHTFRLLDGVTVEWPQRAAYSALKRRLVLGGFTKGRHVEGTVAARFVRGQVADYVYTPRQESTYLNRGVAGIKAYVRPYPLPTPLDLLNAKSTEALPENQRFESVLFDDKGFVIMAENEMGSYFHDAQSLGFSQIEAARAGWLAIAAVDHFLPARIKKWEQQGFKLGFHDNSHATIVANV